MPLTTRIQRAYRAAKSAFAQREYDAAQPHRLLADFRGTSNSADKATRYQAKPMRHRARELRENSAIAARYAALVSDNIIGPDGITLQAVVPSTRGTNEAASKTVEDAWYKFADDATPDGRSFASVCRTLAESWKVEGEALLELIPTPDAPCGLWVQPIDADLLDESHNVDRTPSGGTIVQGVEYSAAGRRIAFHLFTSHPSDGQARRRRILPASRVAFLANRSRPQQTRGVTAFAPVMTLLNHLDRLDESLVVLNRVTASKMYALVANESAPAPLNADGSPVMPEPVEVAPGAEWRVPYGYDVKMLDPGQPTQEYDALARHFLRKIAAGLHVAYASLTGDLSDVNYSSMRAGLLVERDAWQSAQAEFIDAIVRPVFAAFCYTAPLAGAFPMPAGQDEQSIAAASVWHPRRWPWVDPLKDAQAVELLLSLGLTTRTREANKQGMAFADLIAERGIEEQQIKAAGVELVAAPARPEQAAPSEPAKPTPTRQLRAV